LYPASETGLKGIEEMRKVLSLCDINQAINPVLVDITLARGLNYYTGTIFEVTASDVSIGSVCGGGRYDDLTGIFGMPGSVRRWDIIRSRSYLRCDAGTQPLRSGEISSSASAVCEFWDEDEAYSLKALASVRKAGIAAEIYPEPAKIKKQMAYADAKKIPFVVLAGEKERTSRELYP
jgi:histidyl-tRNA synthetase